MTKLTILRGISGSGKSTYAEENYPNAAICSADDYFIMDGNYNFDPSKLSEAHGSCFRWANNYLSEGCDVVIDNTNTQVWEMAPYILLAQSMHAKIEIIRIECNPSVAAKRNVHGVPEHIITRMCDRMEAPLPFWPREKTVGPF